MTGIREDRTSPSVRSQTSLIRALTPWLLGSSAVVGLGLSADYGLLGYLNLWLIYIIGAVALNLLTGLAGLASIGNAALMAVGGYVVATLPGANASLIGGVVLACLVSALIGLIVGLPALRVSGLYLAISTLGLHFIVQSSARIAEAKSGAVGGFSFEAGAPLGFGILIEDPRAWYFLLLVFVVLTCVAVSNLAQSGYGRKWMAIREVGDLAEVFGIEIGRLKLLAFVISSALVGLSGALLGFYNGAVAADSYTLELGVIFIAMIIVGGLATVRGAIIGAGVITLTPYLLETWGPRIWGESLWLTSNQYFILDGLFGALVVLCLMFAPYGIVGIWERLVSSVRQAALNRKAGNE